MQFGIFRLNVSNNHCCAIMFGQAEDAILQICFRVIRRLLLESHAVLPNLLGSVFCKFIFQVYRSTRLPAVNSLSKGPAFFSSSLVQIQEVILTRVLSLIHFLLKLCRSFFQFTTKVDRRFILFFDWHR